jgi:hypothetical protein
MNVADVVDGLERVGDGGSVVDPALVHELVAKRNRNDPLAGLTALPDSARGSARCSP